MRLPGSHEWDEALVRARIAFLTKLAANTSKLITAMAAASGYIEPERLSRRPNDAAFTLARAAELAFAIDDLELGLDLCDRMADLLDEGAQDLTPMQTLLAGTAGAIAGSATVVLNGGAILIIRGRRVISAFGPSFSSSAYNLALLQRAAYGEFASGPSRFGEADSTLEEPSSPAWRSFQHTNEGRMLRATRETRLNGRLPIEIAPMIRELRDSYSNQNEMQRADGLNWEKLPIRGPLIDWRLLAVQTGVIRWTAKTTFDDKLSETADFIRVLAESIVERRRGLRDLET
jgi:hypothetical protein